MPHPTPRQLRPHLRREREHGRAVRTKGADGRVKVKSVSPAVKASHFGGRHGAPTADHFRGPEVAAPRTPRAGVPTGLPCFVFCRAHDEPVHRALLNFAVGTIGRVGIWCRHTAAPALTSVRGRRNLFVVSGQRHGCLLSPLRRAVKFPLGHARNSPRCCARAYATIPHTRATVIASSVRGTCRSQIVHAASHIQVGTFSVRFTTPSPRAPTRPLRRSIPCSRRRRRHANRPGTRCP